MFAEVVVLTYQAPDIGTFTYEIPKILKEKIKTGQLVQVPFGKRSPLGIVIALPNRYPHESEDRILDQVENDTKVAIKPISEIVIPNPLLLPYQIQLLQWMASYYFAPMVNCLEAILPELPRRPLMVNSSSQIKINKNKTNNNERPTINQTLVLVPNINRIPETLAQFPHAKNYVLYHNQLKITERFANWLKILNGQADFVFGSRSAIFVPCPKLSKIIIFDEHDGAYKDERSPYFDTLTIAEKIVELTDAKLEIADSSPKITTYFTHKKAVVNRQRDKRVKVEIVSMADERQAGNKSPISSALSDELEKIRKIKGQALLFLNKKIESGQIYCRACKQQNYAPKMPSMCPTCQSPDIFFHSLNIFSLSDEVKKIVPQSTARLYTEGSRLQTTNYKLSTVDIATSAIFYAQVFQTYDLVAHISTDSVLNIVDFQTSEKFYSQISDLKKLTRDNGDLILQTYNPENLSFKQAAGGDFRNFYESELKMRKMLLYPPYSLLIKLTIKGKNQDLIFQKAKNLIGALKSVQGPNNKPSNPIILGPYEPVFSTRIPRYNIILKVSLDSYSIGSKDKAMRKLLPYISKVPKNWQITVEPDSLN